MHGHSSSEESDDSSRPQVQPTPARNNKQKKKKKKQPPQKSINRIWEKFSNSQFSNALTVLPSGGVSLSAVDPSQSNELLFAGYDRTAKECRYKVEKLISECKRRNMRYQDPDWDVDWDLRKQKGHCLNSLGSQGFKLDQTTFLSSSASIPKAVKRVHEIFENPTFMKNVNGGDVKQGSLGDCWLMAGLTALCNGPDGLKRICVAYDTMVGIYGFVFYRDGEWIYTIIDDQLYLKSACWDSRNMQRYLLEQNNCEDNEIVHRQAYQTGSRALFFAQCRDQNEIWVPLIEKAYAKAHGDYESLSRGWMGEAVEDLSGGVTTGLLTSNILDIDEFWDTEMSRVNDEFLFGASTGFLEYGYGERDGISEGHSYAVMDARTLKSGQRLVKLRDPRGKVGKGTWKGPWSDGSKEWTTEAYEELGHKFGGDSVFWMSYEDLFKKISHFDRTRLFRGHDWRCCQRWIGVDVQWKAEYHERFKIKLTKDSPLCLVLSQLDGRYYVGLCRQYSFRLHFRLHDEDNPNAEDYIARSCGNDLMHRSVSVELPELPAGNYVVHLKVTGERDSKAKSVEEVVKRECFNRVENEKLVQVGRSYDMAHSKARDYMDKLDKLRQKRYQEKASECQQKQRRSNWEWRSTRRHASKMQNEKNKKKQRCREAWEAEQTLLDEEFNAKVRAEDKAAEAVEEADGESEGETFNGAETKFGADKDVQDSIEKDSRDSEKPKAQTAGVVSISTGSPHLTARSVESLDVATRNKQEEEPLPVRARPTYNSADESSDSPVEEWKALYGRDDMVSAVQDDYDTEEEEMPDPWNAICVVGIRVYTKDSGLQLHTVMEGGELLEGAIGEKGAADLGDG